jgi:hypothetical protein
MTHADEHKKKLNSPDTEDIRNANDVINSSEIVLVTPANVHESVDDDDGDEDDEDCIATPGKEFAPQHIFN